MAKPKLLLINPTHGATFWGMNYALDLGAAKCTVAPLAVATVAALTPEDWEITIVDENIEEVDLDAVCDVVGLSAMNVQAARAFELAAEFRRRGRTVVIGGSYASLEPERCLPHTDVLVVGEAERTWPKFCLDFARGEHLARYEETEPIDLALSPVPRYDLLNSSAYTAATLQTTRGCPFSCEFCDVIVLQGRRVRTKPVANVLAELEALRAAKHETIFFADDNFIGNQKYAEQLLAGMKRQRNETGYRPALSTQTTVNLADRPALLAAMVDAGFTRVFLGVESPRQASLREAGKRVNVRGELVDRIHTIQRGGLMVWAGMIVGFDNDDEAIFEEQADFLEEAGIAVAMVGMLNAPPRTPLYARLERSGRLAKGVDWADNCAWTNIVPARMTRPQLFEGYADLITHLYDQRRYAGRVMANINRMQPAQKQQAGGRVPNLHDLGDLWRAFRTFSFHRDPVYRRHFLSNVLRCLGSNPTRFVETCIHLGLWKHFARYVPELSGALRIAAQSERLKLARPQAVAHPAHTDQILRPGRVGLDGAA